MKINILIAILILFFSSYGYSGGSGKWVNDWWNKQQQQREQSEKNHNSYECREQIKRYEQKLRQSPNSDYYKSKLKQIRKSCK